MAYLDRAVAQAGGVVLRYGLLYGAANDGLIEPVQKRQYPLVGDGGGISSWIHLDAAAAATVLALVAGEAAVAMSTEARGTSNAKAKRELGWAPRHAS